MSYSTIGGFHQITYFPYLKKAAELVSEMQCSLKFRRWTKSRGRRLCHWVITASFSSILSFTTFRRPSLVASRSKAWVCGRSLGGIWGVESHRCLDALLLYMLCVVKVEMSATGRSLVERSRTEWVCTTECDRKQKWLFTPTMSR